MAYYAQPGAHVRHSGRRGRHDGEPGGQRGDGTTDPHWLSRGAGPSAGAGRVRGAACALVRAARWPAGKRPHQPPARRLARFTNPRQPYPNTDRSNGIATHRLGHLQGHGFGSQWLAQRRSRHGLPSYARPISWYFTNTFFTASVTGGSSVRGAHR